jgi:hypothetical protein
MAGASDWHSSVDPESPGPARVSGPVRRARVRVSGPWRSPDPRALSEAIVPSDEPWPVGGVSESAAFAPAARDATQGGRLGPPSQAPSRGSTTRSKCPFTLEFRVLKLSPGPGPGVRDCKVLVPDWKQHEAHRGWPPLAGEGSSSCRSRHGPSHWQSLLRTRRTTSRP